MWVEERFILGFVGETQQKEDNIKMDLQEIGWRGKDWIDHHQIRDMCQALVNAVMNHRVP
jgi:hypothetical protein